MFNEFSIINQLFQTIFGSYFKTLPAASQVDLWQLKTTQQTKNLGKEQGYLPCTPGCISKSRFCKNLPPTKRTNPNKGTTRNPPPQCSDAPLGPSSHGQWWFHQGFNGGNPPALKLRLLAFHNYLYQLSLQTWLEGVSKNKNSWICLSCCCCLFVCCCCCCYCCCCCCGWGDPKSTKQNGTKNSWMNPKRTPCLCKINGDEGKTQGPRVLSCLG